jgi:hypothetical protein
MTVVRFNYEDAPIHLRGVALPWRQARGRNRDDRLALLQRAPFEPLLHQPTDFCINQSQATSARCSARSAPIHLERFHRHGLFEGHPAPRPLPGCEQSVMEITALSSRG